MKRFWQGANVLSVIFALVMNFLVGAQIIGVPAINEISDKYATLLTPAGYAFSIWSLVYLLLVVFAVYQARDFMKPSKENDTPRRLGPWFVIANICNGVWTFIFVQEYIALSVVVLGILTLSLYVALWRLRIALYDASIKTIVCVWWPLLIYTGWVTVATVVNIASWFASMGITLSPLVVSLVLVLLVALLLGLLVVRNVRELLLASAWGIAAIGVQQSGSDGSAVVAWCASLAAGVLVGAVLYHGYRNRDGNPFVKKLTSRR